YLLEVTKTRTLKEYLLFHLEMRLPQLLRNEDRNAMAFSIETRHPYLDADLVELALRAPEEQLVSAGERKRILRRSIAGLVPEAVLARRSKIGLQTPGDWLSTPDFRSWYKGLVLTAPTELRNLIDLKTARRLLSFPSLTSRRTDAWRVFSLLLWYQLTFSGSDLPVDHPGLLPQPRAGS